MPVVDHSCQFCRARVDCTICDIFSIFKSSTSIVSWLTIQTAKSIKKRERKTFIDFRVLDHLELIKVEPSVTLPPKQREPNIKSHLPVFLADIRVISLWLHGNVWLFLYMLPLIQRWRNDYYQPCNLTKQSRCDNISPGRNIVPDS